MKEDSAARARLGLVRLCKRTRRAAAIHIHCACRPAANIPASPDDNAGINAEESERWQEWSQWLWLSVSSNACHPQHSAMARIGLAPAEDEAPPPPRLRAPQSDPPNHEDLDRPGRPHHRGGSRHLGPLMKGGEDPPPSGDPNSCLSIRRPLPRRPRSLSPPSRRIPHDVTRSRDTAVQPSNPQCSQIHSPAR